jgi:phosphate transport system substrate-binding protein
MRLHLRACLALLVGAALLLPLESGAEEIVRITGTGTSLGTLRRLAGPFEKSNPGSRLQVLPSVGSSGAFKAVSKGAIDVGISARPLRRDEFGLGLVAFPYARTPLLFAAGPRSEAADLTHADAVRIYRGETLTWPNGERLRLVLRPRADADTELLTAISPELAEAAKSAFAREGMLMAATNQDCVAILERTPGSLGLTSLAQLITEGLRVTPLSWNGVAPTLQNLDSGAYPLQKTLYVVIRAPASPAVRRFVSFLASAEAKRVLEQAGNLPVALPRIE